MPTHNPLVFFKRFLAHPIAVGAVMPTSLATARVMAAPLNPRGTVLEMGAGTGSITQGIVEKLEDVNLLTSVEIDLELAEEFKKNFPNVTLVVGDVEKVLNAGESYNAIVSGIPFSVMNEEKKNRIYMLIKSRLKPDGVFVAIQYSLVLKKELAKHFKNIEIKLSPMNVPPAFIYICKEPISV